MALLGALRLLFNNAADGRWQVLLERLSVAGYGGIFAAFAFVKHCPVVVAAENTAHRYSAAVQCPGHRAAFVSFSAQLANQCLQLLAGAPAFLRMACQQVFQVSRVGVFC